MDKSEPFDSGDAAEWFKRFEICCNANTWDKENKALKLPTLVRCLQHGWSSAQMSKETTMPPRHKRTERMVPASVMSMDGFLKRSL